MTEKQKADRQKRALGLVDLVEKVEGGYRIYSSRDPKTAYFVSKPNGHITCTCSDYEKHAGEDAAWRCNHIEAVILAYREGKVDKGSGNGQNQVEGEPCEICGEKVSERVFGPTPYGRLGLVCWQCYASQEELALEREPIQAEMTPQAQGGLSPAMKRLAESLSAQRDLRDAYPHLTRPFDIGQVEVKPGAVNGSKALAYVDMRSYQARLDEVSGPGNWEVKYRPLGEKAVICKLTILGVTREDVGEADPEDQNAWTSAVASKLQAGLCQFRAWPVSVQPAQAICRLR